MRLQTWRGPLRPRRLFGAVPDCIVPVCEAGPAASGWVRRRSPPCAAGVFPGAAVVVLPYHKSLIAHRLGMKPESLSRGFGRLRAEGVTTDGNRVMVADVEALRAFGETSPLRRPLVGN